MHTETEKEVNTAVSTCALFHDYVCVYLWGRSIIENVLMTYHTRVQADIPRGFSGPQSDRPHSGEPQAGHSSLDHKLESDSMAQCVASGTHDIHLVTLSNKV